MTEADNRKPRPKISRNDQTVSDPVLTNTLASRVRREVALEKATEAVEIDEVEADVNVVVVLGPDGVPQIADIPESAPMTVREPGLHEAPARPQPPPVPPPAAARKR